VAKHNLSFTTLFREPRILPALLENTPWRDFHSLTCTCRAFRYLLSSTALKDGVLSEFVPGYRHGLRERDMQRFQDIPVTMHDLDMLRERPFLFFFGLGGQRSYPYPGASLQLPLHLYPMHALAPLSNPALSPEQVTLMARLRLLTQAHSRFILLLQSMVHSSSSPLPRESPEWKWTARERGIQSAARELIFPPPLSYTRTSVTKDDTEAIDAVAWTVNRHSGRNGIFGAKAVLKKKARVSFNAKVIRRISLFGRTERAPHPPPTQRVMQLYSGSWRRSLYAPQDTQDKLEPPQPRFRCGDNTSCDSSNASISSKSRHFSRDSSAGEPPPLNNFVATSPHDLRMSSSRTRAPVLRVFVPCSELSLPCIQACEEQLIDAGLWDYLSMGDIICNLGYVPATRDTSMSEDGPLEFGDPNRTTTTVTRWLIFNGDCLVQFSPPESPPLDDPLLLPSPFYFVHIIPASVNPKYNLTLRPNENIPELTLARFPTKIPSRHSANGYVVVKKYVWVARIWQPQVFDMGEGWLGDWILESEGTMEGRQTILDCLQGKTTSKWTCEVVKEKSGGRRVWLKLVALPHLLSLACRAHRRLLTDRLLSTTRPTLVTRETVLTLTSN
jgi:hypothetical protein